MLLGPRCFNGQGLHLPLDIIVDKEKDNISKLKFHFSYNSLNIINYSCRSKYLIKYIKSA